MQGTPPTAGAQVDADSLKAYTLDRSALQSTLAGAQKGSRAAAGTTVLSVPAPDGTLQRFAVHETSIMEPGLAAKHPEIKTYAGQGLDDPTASIVADTSPLGFHASVRARQGAFYVDPYYKGESSVHASYYTRDANNDEARSFVESDAVDESKAAAVTAAAELGPEVQLRTYRLALITDPSYATYFGAANVTAAKVTLMNRVNQIYNTESAIKLVLIADTDLLNLNTVALATGANGPCGSAPCFTATNSCNAVLDRNRFVIGQIIGADEVRHRPHRDGQLGRRRRRPGRRRRRQQGDAAAPAWPRRSATSSPSTTWPTRWAISSTATTPSTARWPTAAATAAAPTRSSRAPAPP